MKWYTKAAYAAIFLIRMMVYGCNINQRECFICGRDISGWIHDVSKDLMNAKPDLERRHSPPISCTFPLIINPVCRNQSMLHANCLISLANSRRRCLFTQDMLNYCCPCCDQTFEYSDLVAYIKRGIESGATDSPMEEYYLVIVLHNAIKNGYYHLLLCELNYNSVELKMFRKHLSRWRSNLETHIGASFVLLPEDETMEDHYEKLHYKKCLIVDFAHNLDNLMDTVDDFIDYYTVDGFIDYDSVDYDSDCERMQIDDMPLDYVRYIELFRPLMAIKTKEGVTNFLKFISKRHRNIIAAHPLFRTPTSEENTQILILLFRKRIKYPCENVDVFLSSFFRPKILPYISIRNWVHSLIKNNSLTEEAYFKFVKIILHNKSVFRGSSELSMFDEWVGEALSRMGVFKFMIHFIEKVPNHILFKRVEVVAGYFNKLLAGQDCNDLGDVAEDVLAEYIDALNSVCGLIDRVEHDSCIRSYYEKKWTKSNSSIKMKLDYYNDMIMRKSSHICKIVLTMIGGLREDETESYCEYLMDEKKSVNELYFAISTFLYFYKSIRFDLEPIFSKIMQKCNSGSGRYAEMMQLNTLILYYVKGRSAEQAMAQDGKQAKIQDNGFSMTNDDYKMYVENIYEPFYRACLKEIKKLCTISETGECECSFNNCSVLILTQILNHTLESSGIASIDEDRFIKNLCLKDFDHVWKHGCLQVFATSNVIYNIKYAYAPRIKFTWEELATKYFDSFTPEEMSEDW